MREEKYLFRLLYPHNTLLGHVRTSMVNMPTSREMTTEQVSMQIFTFIVIRSHFFQMIIAGQVVA